MNARDIDDRRLIERAAKKDQSAIDVLFARYQLRICRFLKRMVRNDAIAAELTNEVFVKIWRHAGTFSGRSVVSTWIFKIARNEVRSVLRKRSDEELDAIGEMARKQLQSSGSTCESHVAAEGDQFDLGDT